MNRLKAVALSLATARPILRAVRPTMRAYGTIFMLHRFRNPETGSEGIEPEMVRLGLARLRADGVPLLDLETMFRRMEAGTPLNGAVAFTIDDGYLDQASVAGPLFAEFDCPVSTFLCTGFLDGQVWGWWDQIEHLFRHSRRRSLSIVIGDRQVTYSWAESRERLRWQREFTELCKRVPDAEKHAAIQRLAAAADVELPSVPPPAYAAMSWTQARACEQGGMTFGPHTVTHPILSQTPDAQSAEELAKSWERLRQEIARPLPVFCYPNGGAADFGDRETGTLATLGMLGAVVGEAGYAGCSEFRDRPGARWRVRRFAYPERLSVMVQYASGLERLKARLRGEGG